MTAAAGADAAISAARRREVIPGTPGFFHGQQDVQRLPPLAQRLATDFTTDPRSHSRCDVQLRIIDLALSGPDELGCGNRDLYADGARNRECVPDRGDAYIAGLATAVIGEAEGQVGVAAQVFHRKLVADLLDRVKEIPNFDPRLDYALVRAAGQLDETERNAAAASTRDVDLEIS
ncbi:MAG: DUF2791 family P-loop domain-containing protein [Actinomadura rubrobrunea]|nr:DUF2791 family P-loop domain-containing protein [Actinomadura rubrobrunea]